MSYEFTYMIYLAGCGAVNRAPRPPEQPVDWDRILAFANEQTVLPLVQYAMGKAAFSIPEDCRTRAVSAMRTLAYTGVVQRMGVLKILQECANEGLEVVVFKGFAIARDYAVPDVRVSSDADLWVKESDEDRVLEIFHRNGFQGNKRTGSSKDTKLTHSKFGVVELHVQLFEEFISEIWYRGQKFSPQEPLLWVKDPDGTYCTLGVTDHFLFVLLHMMKHFIVDGLSLRMILDVGILLQAHMDELDHERIAAVLKELRYTRAIQVLLSILCDFCGFSFKNCPWLNDPLPAEDTAVQLVVHDMEQGGVRGYKDNREERTDGMWAYNASLQKQQMAPARFWLFIHFKKLRRTVRQVFPSMKRMERTYGWLKKAPFLYPIAWGHSTFRRRRSDQKKQAQDLHHAQRLQGASTARESSGAKRMEIFRALDMI